jgi:hypothetical protein
MSDLSVMDIGILIQTGFWVLLLVGIVLKLR